ncbi:hypothetical protein T439DRAFT_328692 [Meredithblackwellia eburnea MCA 4105]
MQLKRKTKRINVSSGKKWTQGADKLLLKTYRGEGGKRSIDHLCKLFPGRSTSSVSQRLSLLLGNIKSRPAPSHIDPSSWSSKEEKLLKKLMKGTWKSWEALSKNFVGRSPEAVKERWRLMILKEGSSSKGTGTPSSVKALRPPSQDSRKQAPSHWQQSAEADGAGTTSFKHSKHNFGLWKRRKN